ncbi:MAG: M48 family metallopeptidase [Rhodocyclaceae bacterium]
MSVITARLFGPGLPPAGQDVRLQIDGKSLRTDTPQRVLPETGIRLRRVGLDLQGLELAWDDANGMHALQVLDAAAAATLQAALPASLHGALGELSRQSAKHAAGRRIGWTLLGAVFAAPVLLLVLFLIFADPIAGWIAEQIPVEQERQLGESSFAQMKDELKLRDDTEATRVLRELGSQLTKGSRYTYSFHLADKPEINAFAMPGGIVVVHTGLLKATTRPEELAGVLAHEVQHVELRHSLKSLIKQLGVSALWMFATGDLGSGLAGSAATELLTLKFSRDAEREADAHGLDTLVRNGIDPQGMPDFFRILADKSATPPAILLTHPQSEEREAALRDKLKSLPAQTVQALPWKPWPPAL